jgi:hypothetical protein
LPLIYFDLLFVWDFHLLPLSRVISRTEGKRQREMCKLT